MTPTDASLIRLAAILAASRPYQAAARKSAAAATRRANLPPGSTRARVTTANARWMRAAEERDRLEREVRAAWEAAHGQNEVENTVQQDSA